MTETSEVTTEEEFSTTGVDVDAVEPDLIAIDSAAAGLGSVREEGNTGTVC